VEASAIPAQVGLARTRIAIGAPLLRLRSDEQLVSLFRDGHDDAFRTIHDRYRTRLVAYTRQMLAGSRADAEDAVQEIFVRAYAGLRVDARELALRPWLYRVAHNRCIDELRRPQSMTSDRLPDTMATTLGDPVAHVEQRDALRRLIVDVSRLPEQQRSALLMRELGGMTYVDLAAALGLTVPAVKSLLVRARVSLAAANQARDTTCAEIQADLVLAHDRGVRCSGLARRHLRDCETCRGFRSEIRSTSRQLAALLPLGPLGVIASLLGLGGSGGGGAAAGSGAAATGGAGGLGAGAGASVGLSGVGAASAAGHVVTLLAAAVVTAGGAIELQQHIVAHPGTTAPRHRIIEHRATVAGQRPVIVAAAAEVAVPAGSTVAAPPPAGATPPAVIPASTAVAASAAPAPPGHRAAVSSTMPLTELLDPDHMPYSMVSPGPSTTAALPGPVGSPGSGIATDGAAVGGGGATTSATSATGAGAGVSGSIPGGTVTSTSASSSSAYSPSSMSPSSSSGSGSSSSSAGGSSPSGSSSAPSTAGPGATGSSQGTGSSPDGSTTASGSGSTSTASNRKATTAARTAPKRSSGRSTSSRSGPGATFVVTGRS
jgi:RNA polymerase sigma factor (sigma-70 family)